MEFSIWFQITPFLYEFLMMEFIGQLFQILPYDSILHILIKLLQRPNEIKSANNCRDVEKMKTKIDKMYGFGYTIDNAQQKYILIRNQR